MKLFSGKMLLIPLVFAMACAGSSIKKEELQKMHKVAIIGLDIQQQKSVSGMDLLKIATHSAKPIGAEMQLKTDSAHVEDAYKGLASQLAKKSGWAVLGLDSVRNNPTYKAYLKSKTEGMQNRPATNERYVTFGAPGIVDFFSVMTTEEAKLKELAKALNVDGVVFAQVTVNLNNDSMFASLTGNGEFHPSAVINVLMKNGRTAEQVYNGHAEGPKLEKGEKNVAGMANDENLNKASAQASNLAVEELLKDFSLKN